VVLKILCDHRCEKSERRNSKLWEDSQGRRWRGRPGSNESNMPVHEQTGVEVGAKLELDSLLLVYLKHLPNNVTVVFDSAS
jgi:hypothetical protein